MIWYFISVYINRTLHGRLEIQNFSSEHSNNTRREIRREILCGISTWTCSILSLHISTISQLQSNLAISNSVNSKSPLFRRKIECPWIYPSPLCFPGYFEAPLFRTFFPFPLGLRNSGVRLYAKLVKSSGLVYL